jgi:hypothetical protein
MTAENPQVGTSLADRYPDMAGIMTQAGSKNLRSDL